jgi:uncharacterized protein (DUF1800 family)
MSRDPKGIAALGLYRFGLGPRPGSIAAIASDPQGAMLADIERTGATRLSQHDLMPSDTALRAYVQVRTDRRAARFKLARRMQEKVSSGPPATNEQKAGAAPTMSEEKSMASEDAPNAPMRMKRPGRAATEISEKEAEARVSAALASEIGVAERLIWFWSNHFCVSSRKAQVRSVVGAFEREAIRPHVLGRFADMLLAAESHPAMLMYLDNFRSIGPNSRAGRSRSRGLNENFAREIMELHTLGVRSVYSQADVTNFAKVLTGWGIGSPQREDGGRFRFAPDRHEPGPQTVIGKVYPDTGFEQGRAVLLDIARHPATARHIAKKLATHFVADEPPQPLVDRLSARFLETDGDLKEVSKALLQSDEAWNAPRAKLKRPSEWIVNSLRAVDADAPPIGVVLQAQNMLGEPLWRAPSPRGFSDQSSEWIDGLAERLDIANFLSRRLATRDRPEAVLDAALGPLASEQTTKTVMRAEDQTQALTLLFMAPEFQMR